MVISLLLNFFLKSVKQVNVFNNKRDKPMLTKFYNQHDQKCF